MALKIILLAGDGTGPEVMREAVKVLKAVESSFGVSFDMVPYPCGGQHYLDTGEEWPDGAFESCKAADAILLGAVGLPEARLPNGDLAGAGVLFGLRFGLDLYANVRPTKLYPNVRHKIHDGFKQVWEPGKVDFVIVRENTEGLYTPARGFLSRGGLEEIGIDSRVITRKGAERVIRYAFEVAKQRKGAPADGKSRVTCVDKSNVVAGDRLWRKVYDEVAARYPRIGKDYAYIDAFLQWVVRSPEIYDVAVAPNEFGDIATDLAAVLQGGMGMAAGGNIGDEHGMFEPIHGSSPKHAGKDEVNPIAMVLAVQMMLDWLGRRRKDAALREAAAAVENAVVDVLKAGKVLTYDLGGTAKCSAVGTAIASRIAKRRSPAPS
jgi:isocitrate/isopropylmalate dehydrogenase